MPIANERSTHVPHQRGMPLHERGQGGLGYVVIIRTACGLESFKELTVRQAYRGTDIIEDPEISEHHASSPRYHASRESRSVTAHGGPRLLDHHEYKGSARGFVPEFRQKIHGMAEYPQARLWMIHQKSEKGITSVVFGWAQR
jgi:hypothetical protein